MGHQQGFRVALVVAGAERDGSGRERARWGGPVGLSIPVLA